MASGNNERKQYQNNVNNPCSGAIAYGLFGAADTAIGALITKNNTHEEALTVLVGGVVTGAIAGTVGCCLPDTKDASLHFKIVFGLLNFGLGLTAYLVAPIMGEKILNLGTDWSSTVVDELIGGAIVCGVVVTIFACCFACGMTVVSENDRIKNPQPAFGVENVSITINDGP